ncbi:Mitochondrial N(5)-glutamine methyltransferase MTQ1 [Colletotrichum chlorophyti]|uniref:peptide chain release factor N(5)-glutamine methyltransferase n=1 Tax=Colletotrichum chlorophyti TaxID=708187 RepID=A0A1Q8RKU6_9PEZI|nr:Mitochondrial N(5)-glutamine methyltransferase MTQ1 [Colletotrichum chlorophyti]
MPRLQPILFRRARAISPLVAALLPACRDIPSAVTELRWIRLHVASTQVPSAIGTEAATSPASPSVEARVARLCARRGRGVPLQYVLGSQPFGALDIKCRPGVLAPRAETEAYTLHLAEKLQSGLPGKHMSVIDFCTGTGCIALSLYEALAKRATSVSITGVDVSETAIDLSRENLRRNIAAGALPAVTEAKKVVFRQADVFEDGIAREMRHCDVLVSNPPYIARKVWAYGRGQMGYSVRKYEPRLALVPGDAVPAYDGCEHADVFYARLLDLAGSLRPGILLFEVGDEEQAVRVVRLI